VLEFVWVVHNVNMHPTAWTHTLLLTVALTTGLLVGPARLSRVPSWPDQAVQAVREDPNSGLSGEGNEWEEATGLDYNEERQKWKDEEAEKEKEETAVLTIHRDSLVHCLHELKQLDLKVFGVKQHQLSANYNNNYQRGVGLGQRRSASSVSSRCEQVPLVALLTLLYTDVYTDLDSANWDEVDDSKNSNIDSDYVEKENIISSTTGTQVDNSLLDTIDSLESLVVEGENSIVVVEDVEDSLKNHRRGRDIRLMPVALAAVANPNNKLTSANSGTQPVDGATAGREAAAAATEETLLQSMSLPALPDLFPPLAIPLPLPLALPGLPLPPLPTDHLSHNLRKIQSNIVKDFENFQLPGLPTVGEIKDTVVTGITDQLDWPRNDRKDRKDRKDRHVDRKTDRKLDRKDRSRTSRKLFPNLFQLPEVFPKATGGDDISRAIASHPPTPSSIGTSSKLSSLSSSILDLFPSKSDLLATANFSKFFLPGSYTAPSMPSMPSINNPFGSLLTKSITAVEKTSSEAAEPSSISGKSTDLMGKTSGKNEEENGKVVEAADEAIEDANNNDEEPELEGFVINQRRGNAEGHNAKKKRRMEKKISMDRLANGLTTPPTTTNTPSPSTASANIPSTLTNQSKDGSKVANRFSLESLMDFESMWNHSLSFPIIKQLSEDISKVSEMIKNGSHQMSEDNFDQRLRSDLSNLHITTRVKDAHEEIKKFKLPGLPSIGEILNNSVSMDSLVSPLKLISRTLSSQEPTVNSLETTSDIATADLTPAGLQLGSASGNTPLSASHPPPRPLNMDLSFLQSRSSASSASNQLTAITSTSNDRIGEAKQPDHHDDKSLEENIMEGIKSFVDNSLVKLRYSIDEASKVFRADEQGNTTYFDPSTAVKNLSISFLQGLETLPVPAPLQGLINPEVDVNNLELVLRFVPHMFPYMMQDYKDRLHGLVVGTKITQEQLFEIHSSLVEWHNKIESVRSELPGGEIHRVLGILQEHNLVLMSLLINLMVEAGEQGEVGLTHHHLQVIDRHLIKADDVFPALKDLL